MLDLIVNQRLDRLYRRSVSLNICGSFSVTIVQEHFFWKIFFWYVFLNFDFALNLPKMVNQNLLFLVNKWATIKNQILFSICKTRSVATRWRCEVTQNHRELTWIISLWAHFEDTQLAYSELTRWAHTMSLLWAFLEFATHIVSLLWLICDIVRELG